ncbi:MULTISPECIES: alpha/beta fold hydrolase [Metabacillus]|uniref:Alpha/beta hydrolase n=3 Tax=Metabacillus TaxID=2675233 RepID=A0A179T7G9_9BACI|nr:MULTISPECIES: alpha/beta hydrolase [Metabacillus]OAS89340.1 alpha/beta hydrolase [Metabacillus litoralis]QNF28853.1 alpha/beta hydrolase [Metabacillus sp. KUDC1714]
MKENIIFIHGLTGTKDAFKKPMEYFNRQFNTYSYNLLGHGEDRGKAVDFTLTNLVSQLEDFYEQEGLKEAHLCSLSYGCYPSTIFAKKWNNKVKSLCFIGGHYNSPSQLFDVFKHYWEIRHEDYPTWLRKYSHDIYPKESLLDPYSIISNKIYYKYGLELNDNILKSAIQHRLKYDLRSDLSLLKVPILWVMGDHDSMYKSTLTDLNTVIPHVIYKEIKHAGHAANMFRPSCFRDMYEEFLTSLIVKAKG